MKKKTAFVSALALSAMFGVFAHADTNISVSLNGETVQTDVPPMIINDRAMLPLRSVFNAVGFDLDWNAEEKKITGTKDEKEIEIYIGSTTAYINGEEIKLDAPAVIAEDRTMVPLRFISEAAGFDVDWDAENKHISITDELIEETTEETTKKTDDAKNHATTKSSAETAKEGESKNIVPQRRKSGTFATEATTAEQGTKIVKQVKETTTEATTSAVKETKKTQTTTTATGTTKAPSGDNVISQRRKAGVVTTQATLKTVKQVKETTTETTTSAKIDTSTLSSSLLSKVTSDLNTITGEYKLGSISLTGNKVTSMQKEWSVLSRTDADKAYLKTAKEVLNKIYKSYGMMYEYLATEKSYAIENKASDFMTELKNKVNDFTQAETVAEAKESYADLVDFYSDMKKEVDKQKKK